MTSQCAFPTSISELYFPSKAQNLTSTLSNLHRTTTSCLNRLKSIVQDSAFIRRVQATHDLPLIANERCGSWYIPPSIKGGSAYFKSTDGHTGQWTFSRRRLNIHLLDIIGNNDGCIIVDSTRRGKSMPDALSKTIPIWCAVINQLLFQRGEIVVPESVVGPSERAQMQARLEEWVEDARALNLDLPRLRSVISKPLQPIWITPDTPQTSPPMSGEYHSVICCTASRLNVKADTTGTTYVQGAADDSESWAHGLTPSVFWAHLQRILDTSEDELPELIQALHNKSMVSSRSSGPAVLIQPTSSIFIAKLSTDFTTFDGIIICGDDSADKSMSIEDVRPKAKILVLSCGVGKLGSRALRSQLPRVPPFVASLCKGGINSRILFTCSTGTDLSAGVALAVLCLYFDESGAFKAETNTAIDKHFIRQRLTWLTSSAPEINPSRSTLQAVNLCLMPRS